MGKKIRGGKGNQKRLNYIHFYWTCNESSLTGGSVVFGVVGFGGDFGGDFVPELVRSEIGHHFSHIDETLVAQKCPFCVAEFHRFHVTEEGTRRVLGRVSSEDEKRV